jgi:hypothetical protein
LVRFGKQTVYLAYFKDKDQLDAAMVLDENEDELGLFMARVISV